MKDFEGKSVIITGAANGIGRAAAEELGRRSARVIVADLPGSDGERVASQIRQAGGEAKFVATDVSKATDCEALVRETVSAYGRLDMAFNNAGVVAMGRLLAEEEESTFENVIAVNLKGVFLCLKYEIIAMIESGGGSIVNTSSAAGVVGTAGLASYSASKHGVIGLTRCAAIDYARQGIRVNAVCPGAIDTRMYQSIKHLVDENTMNLMGRAASPLELANTALFLLSAAASFITGAVVVADGGLTAQ